MPWTYKHAKSKGRNSRKRQMVSHILITLKKISFSITMKCEQTDFPCCLLYPPPTPSLLPFSSPPHSPVFELWTSPPWSKATSSSLLLLTSVIFREVMKGHLMAGIDEGAVACHVLCVETVQSGRFNFFFLGKWSRCEFDQVKTFCSHT